MADILKVVNRDSLVYEVVIRFVDEEHEDAADSYFRIPFSEANTEEIAVQKAFEQAALRKPVWLNNQATNRNR